MAQPSDQWREFRHWNRLGIFAFVALMPALAISAFIVQLIPFLSILPLVVGAGCILLFIVSYFQLRAFRCPRCRNAFMVKSSLGTNASGRKCVHCGLKLYADA